MVSNLTKGSERQAHAEIYVPHPLQCERAQSSLECSCEIRKTRLRFQQDGPLADNLLTEGPIFRDNLSALINDSYLLQFFWRFQSRWPLPEAHGTGDGQGPVPLAERCWWRVPNVQIAVLRPQIGATSTMSNTILTLFPNLISAVSHDRLPHSEKWEWRLGGWVGGWEGVV